MASLSRPLLIVGGTASVAGVMAALVYGTGAWVEAKYRSGFPEVVYRAAALELAFERCIAGDVEPERYGDAIVERMTTDLGFETAYSECIADREAAVKVLKRHALDDPHHSERIVDDNFAPLNTSPKPSAREVCSVLGSARQQYDRLVAAAELEVDPLPAIVCAGGPASSAEGMRVAGLDDVGSATLEWIERDGTAIASGERPDARGGRAVYVRASRRGAPEVVELPYRFGVGVGLQPTREGLVALTRPEDDEFVGRIPLRPEVWIDGRAELRSSPRGRRPVQLWVLGERWIVATLGPREDADLGFSVSDDGGRSWQELRIEGSFPPGPGRVYLRALEIDDGLLVVASRPDPDDETAPRSMFGAFRIARDGSVRGTSIELAAEYGSTCANERGAFALVGGSVLVRVGSDGDVAVAHTFASGHRVVRAAIGCHGDAASIYGMREEDGKAERNLLHRFACTANGCEDGTLVAASVAWWTVAGTETGTRVLVNRDSVSDDALHVVDEPAGGPLERRELLGSTGYSNVGVVWHDGVAFGSPAELSPWF